MFVYLWAISTGSYPLILVLGIVTFGVVYSAANGIWPSFYGEMFTTRVRLSGMAIGTQIGFAVAGFAVTFAAEIAGPDGDDWCVRRPVHGGPVRPAGAGRDHGTRDTPGADGTARRAWRRERGEARGRVGLSPLPPESPTALGRRAMGSSGTGRPRDRRADCRIFRPTRG